MSAIRGEATPAHWPNKMGRMLLASLDEVLGSEASGRVLRQARLDRRLVERPPDDLEREFGYDEVSQVMRALEEVYGPHAGRDQALAVGQVSFRYGLWEFGSLLGLVDLDTRLVPQVIRLRIALDALAATLHRYAGQRVEIDERDEHFVCTLEACPVCWHRQSSEPCCHAARGMLSELATWVSGGKHFRVQETGCTAAGDRACTFVVDKRPLEPG